jgi:2-phospho-L-lactate guanylyltransferase
MNLWLLIPVKPFSEGKSRLASTLDIDERARLSRRLLRRVLQITRESKLFAGSLVVSRDPAVLREATEAGSEVMLEHGSGLNPALHAARDRATENGADAILILPSDLPLLEASDLHRLLLAATLSPSIAIAPSYDGGTNALFLHPPYAIDFAFGPDSYRRHHEQATVAGMTVHIIHSPTLALDIDWPDDLRLLESMGIPQIG